MAVTYTDATKVKSRFEDIDTDLSDTEIDEFINCAESVVDAVMKKTGRTATVDFTFAAAKHGIIEEVTSLLAAFSCLACQPTGETAGITVKQAALMCDLWFAQIDRLLGILADHRVVNYLIGL